ncbi:arginine--tRNA ligase [Suicoccus acidiformans]|uniref:Arginine--tRNA ligase n=1 Tax=Suicoccus acidiformans TaxID=2036206 RepID=A0A347WMT2_9LACT|nr:arginine--tRNA ligase [Suicoccus acidiformans]AXY26389.1 arginine--tRNA ligase [Suicoccus acidiformans]
MNNEEILVEALRPAVGEYLDDAAIERLIEVPNNPEHGDLAFPTFQLAKVLRKAPQMIAEEVAEAMDKRSFSEVKVIGPYINVKLQRTKVGAHIIEQVLAEGATYGSQNIGQGEVMTIDFSSPNIAKPMSMGHLRSTVIGHAIANIATKTNYQPVRINHLGDWGTQFGKLIVAYKGWGDEAKVRANPVQELVKLYVEFHEKAESDPSLDEAGRAAFKALEDGDEEMLALWGWFREESLKEFQKVYDILGVTFDSYHGEAFFNDKMEPVIQELEDKGITEVNEGATIVDLSAEDLPPALIKKSDGATLYVTRDLAAAFYRKNTYDFAKNVYVVGNEQRVHFQQLKAVLSKMGYAWSEDIVHVPFGLITKDGRKLSTRKGDIVLLEDVLKEAIDLAYEQIEAKNPDLEMKDQVAHDVGVGAVIFHDLKTDRMNSFDFNLQEIVEFEGETGPYVQYTYARAKSILRKVGSDAKLTQAFNLDDDYSWDIVKKLGAYPQIIAHSMERYEPSVIAKYAVQLAQAFNKYYANVRILEEDDQRSARIALVQAMTIVLKDALALLGVNAPEEM